MLRCKLNLTVVYFYKYSHVRSGCANGFVTRSDMVTVEVMEDNVVVLEQTRGAQGCKI